MTTRKMLVVYLSSTRAVLGVASRRAPGAPPVEDLVGAAMPVRAADMESGVAIAAADLAVKEVDYSDEVFRQPLKHGLDASDAVVLVTPTVSPTVSAGNVVLTMTPAPPADKSAVVVIDAGSSRDPLKFMARTTTSGTLNVPVTGVPPGSHDVLASVDGYVSKVATGSF